MSCQRAARSMCTTPLSGCTSSDGNSGAPSSGAPSPPARWGCPSRGTLPGRAPRARAEMLCGSVLVAELLLERLDAVSGRFLVVEAQCPVPPGRAPAMLNLVPLQVPWFFGTGSAGELADLAVTQTGLKRAGCIVVFVDQDTEVQFDSQRPQDRVLARRRRPALEPACHTSRSRGSPDTVDRRRPKQANHLAVASCQEVREGRPLDNETPKRDPPNRVSRAYP